MQKSSSDDGNNSFPEVYNHKPPANLDVDDVAVAKIGAVLQEAGVPLHRSQ